MMKARKFRRRADDDDDVQNDDAEKPSVKAEKTEKDKAKEKTVPSKHSAPILLSFAEDNEFAAPRETKNSSGLHKGRDRTKGKPGWRTGEENEDRIPKKKSGFGADKSSGHRLGLGRDKSSGNLPILSNVQPQAGEYTKEKLAELQRSTIRLGAPGPPPESPAEPVVVLKGLVKPAGVTNSVGLEKSDTRESLGGEPAIITDSSDRIDRARERDDRDRLRRDNDDAESRLGLMGIGTGAESGGITHIPDAAAIAAAKAKRERLRQAQAAPDYISLAPGDGADFRSKCRDSALVKEQEEDLRRDDDDSSADEAEVQGRVAFLGDKAVDSNKRSGVFESAEERMEARPLQERRDEDEEDEERRWEEEQLRKGVGKRVDESANRSIVPSAAIPSHAQATSGFSAVVHPVIPPAGPGWGFGRALEGLSVVQQADSAMRTLQENLQRMREGHGRIQSELFRAQENLSLSVQTVSSLENTLASASEKYVYMQELQEYISVLCDFLQDKAPLIEELEEHMQRLHEERANAVTERRVGDNADELAEVEVAVEAVKAVLSRSGGTAAATAAASAAVASFAARDGLNLAPELDEFGRDINLQKRMDIQRRAQARLRRSKRTAERRASRMSILNGDGVESQSVEGESSSEESESEATAYQSRREEVLETAEKIFGDAADEFAQLQTVKQKLESWKFKYSSAYRDAYVSLSAPAIFAPYVRLELLQWDPLYGDTGFSNMQWYQRLFEYGMPQNRKERDLKDLDGDLVPKLVEKVALPILHHEIAHCWDRLSSKGTHRALAAVMDMLIYVPATSEALQELLSAVRMRMADAVSNVDVPTWSLPVINAVPQAARLVAQKFGTSVRLLRNIGMWKDVLAMPLLESLALDDLLSKKVLPHLRTLLTSLHDAVTRTERVMAALAGVWVGSNRQVSPKLASFVEFVTALTRAVEKKRDGGASVEDGIGLARRMKRMLVELNEYDRAQQLAKHFQLREAL